ncbi:hypothetical protein [Sphingomonas sp. Leaf231]|uniref:hypothetical protein n=1 Tax=Sphingomonas sp. Leaf231 TaxID=1736301 RepID=UPI001910B834|nr:hypothetical protein [Sphingomonas sp. Leaf231]
MMSLRSIHLRKLLKILFSPENKQTAALRSDIRDEIAREAEGSSGGGDFYASFWSDAKAHAIGVSDLHRSIEERIAANAGREGLYPRLRDGFLLWWNEGRRFTNAPFHPGSTQKARFLFPGVNDAIVKVEGVLSLRDGNGIEHYVYPYFSPEPVLTESAARLGLWLLTSSLPGLPPEEIRILDVIRGATYSVDRYPLRGNEEEEFRSLYVAALDRWDKLRREYG